MLAHKIVHHKGSNRLEGDEIPQKKNNYHRQYSRKNNMCAQESKYTISEISMNKRFQFAISYTDSSHRTFSQIFFRISFPYLISYELMFFGGFLIIRKVM